MLISPSFLVFGIESNELATAVVIGLYSSLSPPSCAYILVSNSVFLATLVRSQHVTIS